MGFGLHGGEEGFQGWREGWTHKHSHPLILNLPFIYDEYSDDDDIDMLEVISLCNLGTIQWGYVHQVFNESPNNVHLDMNNSQTYPH